MVGKLAPNSSHLTRGLVKYVPGRSYFRAVSSQNGDKFVTSPRPSIVERVLGTINFARKFIPILAIILDLLVALTRKSVANLKPWRNLWGSEQDTAFVKVKELLSSAPVLQFPRFHKLLIIHIAASECGVGAFLAQKEDNGELVIIAYFSKRFTSSQPHYFATQKECLAVVLAVTHWRPYMWGRHFVCVTGSQRSSLLVFHARYI